MADFMERDEDEGMVSSTTSRSAFLREILNAWCSRQSSNERNSFHCVHENYITDNFSDGVMEFKYKPTPPSACSSADNYNRLLSGPLYSNGGVQNIRGQNWKGIQKEDTTRSMDNKTWYVCGNGNCSAIHTNSPGAPYDIGKGVPTTTSGIGVQEQMEVVNYKLPGPASGLLTSSYPENLVCEICGDNATGRHYGVNSCEGCKGFFKRSIRKEMEYKNCRNANKCEVTKLLRNRCQSCRLLKCIRVGMRTDAVQMERKPIKEVNLQPENIRSCNYHQREQFEDILSDFDFEETSRKIKGFTYQNSGRHECFKETPVAGDIRGSVHENRNSTSTSWSRQPVMTSVAQIQNATMSSRCVSSTTTTGCFLTSRSKMMFEKIDKQWVVPTSCTNFSVILPSSPFGQAAEMSQFSGIEFISEVASRILMESVKWACSLPVFQALSDDMKLEVLKSSWSELFVLALVQCESELNMTVGDVLFTLLLHVQEEYESCSSERLSNIAKAATTLKEFIATTKTLEMNGFEFAAIKTMCLFHPDKYCQFDSSLVDQVEEVQTWILNQLKYWVNESGRMSNLRLEKMLLNVSRLRGIKAELVETVFFYHFIGQLNMKVEDIIPNILKIQSDASMVDEVKIMLSLQSDERDSSNSDSSDSEKNADCSTNLSSHLSENGVGINLAFPKDNENNVDHDISEITESEVDMTNIPV